MTRLIGSLLAGSSLLCCTLHADVVADWNAIALNAVESSGAHPANALQAVAGIHVAMFEAMNFIERRYVPRFVVRPVAPISASSAAAAAAAAHHVLAQLYPDQAVALDAALNRSLAQISDGSDKASGTITGKAIGANLYAVWPWHRSAPESTGGPADAASEPLLWNLIAAKLIEGRGVAPIAAARVHALVSFAVSEVYSASVRNGCAARADAACVACAACVATLSILESALAPGGIPPVAGSGMWESRAWVRVLEHSDQGSLRKLDDGTILRALVIYNERSAGHSERRLGERSGKRALAHYRPVQS